jgi:mannitol-1-phosphate/altronate dehydrogenase
MEKKEVLVFGAGALGLGFLGPELHKRYSLTFADREFKGEFLAYLGKKGEYRINLTTPGIEVLTIIGVKGLNLDDKREREKMIKKIGQVSLIFTAVGLSNLKEVAPILVEGIEKHPERKEPLYILCCENGRDVPAKFKGFLRERMASPPSWVKIGEPIAGRMCRYEDKIKPWGNFEPVARDFSWGIVAEPFYGIPIKRSLVPESTAVSPAFQLKEDDEFEALKERKMLIHNGCHAFLAFLGHLKGYTYYCQLEKEKKVLRLAEKMVREEMIEALLSRFGGLLDRNDLKNYSLGVLRRIISPLFGDSVSRGTRGSLEKLAPQERLIWGARFIWSAGFLPKIYSMGIAAAIKINQAQGRLTRSLEEILSQHCGLKQPQDAKLIELINHGYSEISERFGSQKSEGSSSLHR